MQNLIAFTRLLGYVRHFHPSDRAAEADWDRLAVEGIRAVESASGPEELARRLQEVVRPVAPLVRVFVSGAVPPVPEELASPPRAEGLRVVAWEHLGYGGTGMVMGMVSAYQSQRVPTKLEDGKPPAGRPDPAKPYFADLGGGVCCLVPLALYADEKSTLPPGKALEKPARQAKLSAEDRATRLAAVALGWNILQHFYPYFDVVQTDWPAALREALATAATDADEQRVSAHHASHDRRASRRARERFHCQRSGRVEIDPALAVGLGAGAIGDHPRCR